MADCGVKADHPFHPFYTDGVKVLCFGRYPLVWWAAALQDSDWHVNVSVWEGKALAWVGASTGGEFRFELET